MKVNTVLLSLLSICGVVGTSYLIYDTTLKNSDVLKNNNLNKKEKFNKIWKNYIPAAGAGLATIATITAGTIISKKTEASITAVAVMAKKSYDKYQYKVKEFLGIDNHKKVMSEIAKDETKNIKIEENNKTLYFNQYIGSFYSTEADIKNAFNALNMRLCSTNSLGLLKNKDMGWCSFEDFVKYSKAEILQPDIYEQYKNWGWTTVQLQDMSYDNWIYDAYHDDNDENGNIIKVIEFMGCDPIMDAYENIEFWVQKEREMNESYANEMYEDE